MAVKRSSSGGSHSSSSNKTSSARSSSSRSSSRPTSHARRTSGTTTNRSTSRRGGGLNLGGPVGNANGAYRDRPGNRGYTYEDSGGGGGVSVWIIVLIVLIIFVAAGGGSALSDVFEDIFHSVKEQTEDIDTDAISQRFGEAVREGAEELGLTGDSSRPVTATHNRSAAVASRSMVTQFSGVLSNDSDEEVEPIKEDYDATEQPVKASAPIDVEKFYWSTNDEGLHVLKLSDEDWEQIEEVKLNVFLDDGEGYIDLGLDSYFEFDDNLDLIGEYDYTWMCFDDYPVTFYHLTTIEKGDDWRMIGYVPVFLNDEHANIIVAFDNDNPEGYIAGAKLIEEGPGTDLSVEEMVDDLIEVKKGDTLDFICDYYDYDGEFINNYFFGERMTIGDTVPEIWYYEIPGDLTACYLLIDSNGNHYWTPIME